MRSAARVLTMIAAILALLFGLVCYLFGFLIANTSDALPVETEAHTDKPPEPCPVYLLVPAIFSGIAFGAGIAGFILMKKRGFIAGLLAASSAVLSAFTVIGIVASCIFVAGAVLAFLSNKAPASAN